MNTNPKPRAANADAAQQLRDLSETGVQHSNDAFERIGVATNETAELIKNCFSTAAKGARDYHTKLIEFTQANAKSHAEFLQKLAASKGPAEVLEVMNSQTRQQLERLADQAKELTELAKEVTLATAEPLKNGIAKVYGRAA